MKHCITFVLFCGMLCFSVVAFSQDYYAVHFKFKPQDTYSLDQPSSFLSLNSIERKVRFNIEIDSMDLPVSQKYISDIQPFILENLYNSNWLNAAIVLADSEQIKLISGLPYVEQVVSVRPGGYPDARTVDKTDKFKEVGVKSSPADQRIASETQNALLEIDKMHEAGYKGANVTIAVFDAGFLGVDTLSAFGHIYTTGRIVGTRNFVDLDSDDVYTSHPHGTNVLSLIGAYDPPQMVAGAPEANFILCLTEDVHSEYKIEEYNWVRAAEYSDSLGVDIINSSLGYFDFDDPGMDYSSEDLDGKTAIITKGANIAADKGILVVNSAGNYGRRGPSSIAAPADAKGILAVGGVDYEKERSAFSSQGPTADGRIKPELAALGQSVFILAPSGESYLSQGTSFAAPQITALAAGLWQAKPEWSKDELIDRLLASSSQADSPDNFLGHGIPGFIQAYYGEILSVSPSREPVEWNLYPNPILRNELYIRFGNEKDSEFILFDISGREIVRYNLVRTSIEEPFAIQLPNLRAGVYVVEMRSAYGVKRVRVIKR